MTSMIDTSASRHAARRWIEWGDQLDRARAELRVVLEAAGLGGRVAWAGVRLAAGATGLWTASTFLRLVVERAEDADTAGASLIDSSSVGALVRRAAGSHLPLSACPAVGPFAPANGDPGGTFHAELRGPFLVDASDPATAGRRLVVRALRDTASSRQIREDEFEIVDLSDGRHLVVLPGVIDLSRTPWWSETSHRSVRDLDRQALPSSRSSAVADNGYARMVWDSLRARGVPPGSELIIVGHSFGADTALDLAADGRFNGDGGYRVTHVVAAGYASGPQLADVPRSTRVLVLQNRRDALVIAERVGQSHVTDAGYAAAEAIGETARLDAAGALGAAGAALLHGVGAVGDGAAHVVDRRDDVFGVVSSVTMGRLERAGERLTDLLTLEPGVSHPTEAQVVAVFDGGTDGFGHRQTNYVQYLQATREPAVSAFLASLAGTGRGVVGTAVAVDVSEPDLGRPAQKT
jgi:hypothetical protein